MPIPPLEPIPLETQQSRVYKALARALLIGQFKPGEAITVRSVTDALGTGTMPVREALHRLVAKGALEFLPNRTACVPLFTAAEFDELLDERVLLECFATGIAAQRISAEEIEAAEQFHNRIVSLTSKLRAGSNPEPLLTANARFHFAIYHAARSRHLVPLIETLWLRMGPLRLGPFLHTEELKSELHDTNAMHVQLIAALRDHDADGAKSSMRTILERAGRWYRRFNVFAEENDSEHPTPVSELIL